MNTYTDELKANVISDILIGTMTLKEVSEKHSVPYGTVRSWSSRVSNSGLVATEKKPEIGDLLLQVLQLNLNAQMAQMDKFSDPDWLDRQNAHDLAILHGVLNDKAVRLIEAFKNGNSD
jgi:transposase-like protein